MFRIPGIINLSVVVVLTIASGLLFYNTSKNRQAFEMAEQAAKKLESFPEQFGPWRLENKIKLTDNVIDMLQCNGYISCKYVNDLTGLSVQVFILLGPTGPTSVHTPEICYSSREFKIIEDRRKVSIGKEVNSQDEFWVLLLEKKNDPLASKMRAYYGWTSGKVWEATNDPRFHFAGTPYLYKLQLACSAPRETDAEGKDTGQEFLEAFLPVLRNYLVEPAID